MNKTIIININGIVFHIEEEAYEVLRSYMTDVKRHFAYSPDSEEIVTDIENRLAEMFTERLTADHKQVIDAADVADVTQRMGNVNDFESQDGDEIPADGFLGRKRLFRDVDDRVIGGVCSGLGHYFGIPARWIRLLAILSILMAGSGLPIYVILWIIIPKAVSRADKMSMKGEPINIQNFKKNFDEEIDGLRTGFQRAQSEARPAIDGLTRLIGSTIMILLKAFIAFIAFIGIIGMIALFIGLFTFLGYWNASQLDTFPFNVVNPGYKSVLALSAFIIIFIPLAAFVLFAIRVLVARVVIPKIVYFSMLVIWIAGMAIGVYHTSQIVSDFKKEAKFTVTKSLEAAPVYVLKVNPVQFLTKEDSVRYKINPMDFKDRIIINSRNNDFDEPRNVRLRIEKADVSQPVITQEFSARGGDFEAALSSARRAKHGFVQTDSLLMFDAHVHLDRGELWRDQSVSLVLRVPENTRIRIEGRVSRYLDHYNLWECQPENVGSDHLSEWLMTPSGLKCQDAEENARPDSVTTEPAI